MSSSDQLREFREDMTDIVNVYQRLFYEDALHSLRSGRPVKSAAREAYEHKMRTKGRLSEAEIRRNDDYVAKVAARQPIEQRGRTLVLDEATILAVLDGLDATAQRVDTLLT